MGDWDEFSAAIRANADDAAVINIMRDGRPMTLETNTMVAERFDTEDPAAYSQVGFLGVVPAQVRERQGVGYVVTTMGDFTQRTAEALLHMPERMVGVAKAAVGVSERDPESPMSIVGASRVAGEVASDDANTVAERWAALLMILGVVNLFVAMFNFIPLLPLDGGHIASALWEAVRRGLARLRGLPDPGFVDAAKLLPIAYVMASVMLVMSLVLIVGDLVVPIHITPARFGVRLPPA
jgi:membrane-associated protease RseP (regulator of RpoE activity)